MREVDDVPSLDLLRCFAAMHHERHLSRAATRVGLSQPAMSRALARLRETFDDALFVRTPRGMLPTPRADELVVRVQRVLEAAEALVDPPVFDPSRLARTFTIATSGFVDGLLLPRLVTSLAAEAPGVAITTRPLGDDLADALATGRVDLSVGVRESVPTNARVTRLFEERYVCAVRRDHPVVRSRLTSKRYVELAHLVVAPGGMTGGAVDRLLAARGLSRRVVVRVHSFAGAPEIVASSDLVLTAPARAIEPLSRPLRLRVFPLPFESERFPVFAAWHPRMDDDLAHRWFRETLVAVSRAP